MQDIVKSSELILVARDNFRPPSSLPQTSSFSDRVSRGRANATKFFLRASEMSTTLADALLESRASSTNFGILKLVALKFQADKMFNEGKKVRVHDVFALKGVEFVITFSDDVHFHNMVRYTYVNVKKDPSWDDYYGRSSDEFTYSEYLSRMYILKQELLKLLEVHGLEKLMTDNWEYKDGVFRFVVGAWEVFAVNDVLQLKKIDSQFSYTVELSKDKVVVLENNGE